jgi:hypothetical protein
MLHRSAIAKALWLLAIVVFAVRVGDAHLHFCADGQEQAVVLHVADAPGQHHASESKTGHEDRDLDVSGPTLIKMAAGADELDLAPLVALALVLLLPIVGQLTPRGLATSTPFAAIFLLRPPLRGPPR